MTVLEMEDIAPTIDLEVQEVMEGSGGTTDYEKLNNKPSINEVELSGDKSLEDLGISPLSNMDILNIIKQINEGGVKNVGGKAS